jgi:hypothetical protein
MVKTASRLTIPEVAVTTRGRSSLRHRRPTNICNHTFRADGITMFLLNGGTLENAQAIAAHEPPRTTKLYDRKIDEIILDEVERIRI